MYSVRIYNALFLIFLMTLHHQSMIMLNTQIPQAVFI